VPELPEVETLRRDAERALVGRRIASAELLVPEVLRAPEPAAFESALAGASFVGARRRAKYLFLDLDLDVGQVLALQLAIYGQLLLLETCAARDPDTLLALALADGAELHLRDRSRYTRVWLAPPERLAMLLRLDELGPEPLAPEFDVDCLRARLGGRRARLKGLLLDQHVVAGLGNIYVDEALWRARLHPARTANSLSDAELAALHAAIQSVLREAIEHRGTTFHTYRDLFGQKGEHQSELAVFHRQGHPCPRCGTPIERTTLASRDTHLCPTCQVAAP
jgi:formamidopyrimidine-DNA glycosylase